MATFTLPHLQETPEIWGPPSTASTSSTGSKAASGTSKADSVLPVEFRNIPFTPFAKSDKIGRFADWNVGASAQGGDGSRAGAGAAAGSGGLGGGEEQRNAMNGGLTVRNAAAGLRGVAGGQAGNRRNDGSQTLGAGASTFTYFHGSDDASFSIVDNARASAGKRGGLSQMTRGRGGAAGGRGGAARGGPGGMVGGYAGRGGIGGGRGGGRFANQRGGAAGGGAAGGRGGRRPGFRDWDRPQRTREPSVAVGADWEQIEEIEFSRLQKLRLDVAEGEDLSQVGTLFEYDRAYDRITSARFEKPLQSLERVRYNLTSSEDPILQDLASKPATPLQEGSEKVPTRIFVTDSILATLMCATRSVYPWDIVITRDGNGNVFLDKRDGGAFDYITVNENAADPPLEADAKDGETAREKSQLINTPGNLSLEATYINQNFAFQVVNEKKKHRMPDGPNPFYDENTEKEQQASCAYRYRKFDLSTPDHDVELVVRAELDAINPSTTKGQPPQYITIKTLNEFDSRAQGAGGAPEWRTKLDSQRGAVVATEMKNNGAKLARFAVQAVLAKADNMKMGYISRVSPRDAQRHAILGTQWYKPRDFAAQINVNFANGWGIVRTIADLVSKPSSSDANAQADKAAKLEPAKFVLAKDPNKPVVRLYRVPLTWPAEDGDDLVAGSLADTNSVI